MRNPTTLHITRQPYRHSPHKRLSPSIAITEAAHRLSPRLPPYTLVIFRGYHLPNRENHAKMLAQYCRKKKWRLLIAGDPRLAVKVNADGIHIPESQGFRLSCWRKRKPGWVITMAAHKESTLWNAARLGADAALLSPVFSTASHPEAKPLGAVRFNRLIQKSPVAVYALGGMSSTTLSRLKGTKACGVAGIGMFLAS